MGTDDQTPVGQPFCNTGIDCRGRGNSFRLAAVALVVATVATATGFLMSSWLRPKPADPVTTETETPKAPEGERLFRGWPRPDVALVLSGQQYGYLQPCGCSEIQLGGLARRYNFVQQLLKERGWQVVLADLGDLAQGTQEPTKAVNLGPQRQIKYHYSMESLKLLNYAAVGIGQNEAAMPLLDALAQYSLNDKKPRVVCANLVNANGVYVPDMVSRGEVVENQGSAPRVGITGVVGASMAKELTRRGGDDVRFDKYETALPEALRLLQQQKSELLLLLFLGTETEARECALKFPQVHVILCWDATEDPSSERGEVVGNTLIVRVGQRGRYIGVVGANRTGNPGQPFTLRYQMVAIGPPYNTPDARVKDNPIHAALENYTQELKRENYLAKFLLNATHPVQVALPESAFVGSEKCQKCHPQAYEIWKAHKHSQAYQTLVNAKRPSLREYDGECVVCHTIGFGYKTGFTSAVATPKLKNVGCESCHGPASLHAQKPNDPQLRAALNPLKGKGPVAIGDMCIHCHDQDNSNHFQFEEYWDKKKTAHPTPKDD
jgi:hypothetical protein